MKDKNIRNIVFIYTLFSCLSEKECLLEHDDFVEYYIDGTSDSLNNLSETALKYVSSSSEDLQRLYAKESETKQLIQSYKLSIQNIIKEIKVKGAVSKRRDRYVRKIRKVTKTYFRPVEEFEDTSGLGIVKLDDVHEFDKMEFANGTIDLPMWGARYVSSITSFSNKMYSKRVILSA